MKQPQKIRKHTTATIRPYNLVDRLVSFTEFFFDTELNDLRYSLRLTMLHDLKRCHKTVYKQSQAAVMTAKSFDVIMSEL